MLADIFIFTLWEEKDFKNGTENEKIKLLKELYDKTLISKDVKSKKENWEKSLPLVKKLVNCTYETTKFLRTNTIWGGRECEVQLLNLSPVKHNEEFLELLLAIGNIWGNCFSIRMEEIGLNLNDNIQNSTEKFLNKYKECRNEYAVCINNLNGHPVSYSKHHIIHEDPIQGSFFMGSQTQCFDAICL